jgi:uncharacterized membrane protein YhaH (DUF805 family)
MSFGDAIGECFFNYANFKDRAARAEYWWWALFASVVYLAAWLLDFVIFAGFIASPFFLVVYLALLLPGLSVAVRRLHDTGRTGWWLMLPTGAAILTVIGAYAAAIVNPDEPPAGIGLVFIGLPALLVIAAGILLLVWMFQPGDPGNNRYGPNRYAGA